MISLFQMTIRRLQNPQNPQRQVPHGSLRSLLYKQSSIEELFTILLIVTTIITQIPPGHSITNNLLIIETAWDFKGGYPLSAFVWHFKRRVRIYLYILLPQQITFMIHFPCFRIVGTGFAESFCLLSLNSMTETEQDFN